MTEANPYTAPSAELSVEPDLAISALATRWSRLLARLTDCLGNAVAFAPLLLAIYFALPDRELYLLSGVLGIAGSFAGFRWVRYNLRMMSRNGQTFGKIAMGIKVVRTDNSRLNLLRWFTHRFLVVTMISAIPKVGGIVALANYLAIFRESRKCLHDEIADTKVVKV